jgi:hypothetical protein
MEKHIRERNSSGLSLTKRHELFDGRKNLRDKELKDTGEGHYTPQTDSVTFPCETFKGSFSY